MSHIRIRPTIPTDLSALAGALVEVHAIDGYPVEGVDDPLAWVKLPDAIGQWTALVDDLPVGHVALMRPGPGDGAPEMLARRDGTPLSRIAVLGRLFVAPDARGRALACALMDAAEAMAKRSGHVVVLDVMAKDVAAIKLYESRGWQSLGKFEHMVERNRSVAAWAFAGARSDLK